MGLSGVGSSSSSIRDLQIDYQKGQYSVNGKATSEPELNKALAPNGIVAKSGNFKTTDGFDLGSSNNGAASDFGGATPLPEVAGPGASHVSVGEKASWLSGMSDGLLMWAAMSEMAKQSMRDMHDAKELKNAMSTAKIDAKTAQINATEKQVEAERKAATEQLVIAVCSAVVTAIISGAGALMGPSTAGGSFVSSLAQPVGNVAQKAGEAWSKNEGAGREADDKKIEVKRWEREEAVMDDAIDSAKSSYEDSKEQFKLAIRVMQEHVERQTQVVQKITS